MISLEDIKNLDTDRVEEISEFLTDFIKDQHPDLDLTRGSALYNLLIRPQAIYHALNQTNIQRLRDSSSLLSINQDPTLADDEVVDNLLSNYNIERQQGTAASGQLLMIFTSQDPVTVPVGTKFSSSGVDFSPTQVFNGVVNEDDVLSDQDRVIKSIGDNLYSLTIDVAANQEGPSGNLAANTVFTTDGVFNNLKEVVAAEDFDGGKNTESNEELITRMQDGLAVANLGSRLSIESTLRQEFPSVQDISIVGAGNSELTRDKHNTLGLGEGGKVDIYVKTRDAPKSTVVTKEATVIESNELQTKWRLNFDRDDYPGFYEVSQVRRESDSTDYTYEISKDTRSTDLSSVAGSDSSPEGDTSELTFTRYQTAEVTFIDTKKTNLSSGDTEDFKVTVLYMPELDTINDFVRNRQNQHPAGDYLVKGPLPCLVSVGLVIDKDPNVSDIDTEELKSLVSNEVNSTTFEHGSLTAARLTAVVQNNLPGKSHLKLPVEINGKILVPNSDPVWLFSTPSSNYQLTPPDRPELMLTSQTVSFSTKTNDISITVNS